MKWSDFMSRDAPKSDLIPVYEEMGKKLVVMYNYEKNLAESNKYSYPTVPRVPYQAIKPGEEPRGSASTSESSEDAAPQSPIQDLIRFVKTSALRSDSGVQLEPHEAEYNRLLRSAPETYSCFREQNPQNNTADIPEYTLTIMCHTSNNKLSERTGHAG